MTKKLLFAILCVIIIFFSSVVFYNKQNIAKPTTVVQNKTICPPLIQISKLNDTNIDYYKNTRKYLEAFSQEELVYGVSIIYPTIKNTEQIAKIYFEGLRCKDKTLVKMLTTVDFPSVEKTFFNEQFERIWSQFSGKNYEIIYICPEYSNCSGGIFVKYDNFLYKFQATHDYNDPNKNNNIIKIVNHAIDCSQSQECDFVAMKLDSK